MAEERMQEPEMDAAALYLEEMITDRKVGAIRRLTPLNGKGERDQARPVLYLGQTEIMTNMGAIPINFEIEAQDLAAAISGFGKAASQAIERTIQQIQELRRQQQSQLVVPQGGIPGLGGPQGPLGGGPGRGGKIQIP
jgi:hypothetical protein